MVHVYTKLVNPNGRVTRGMRRLALKTGEAQVVRVDGAGHSVQGDQPVVLADILERVCF